MRYIGTAVKVLIIFAIALLGYYFVYLLPHQMKVKEVSAHYSNLVENRTAYVNLAKLNPESPSFDIEKSNLVGIIKKSNAKGLENPISDEERLIFERQSEILSRVFATNSYREGVVILKSEESVKLLSDQLDLIEKYKNTKQLD